MQVTHGIAGGDGKLDIRKDVVDVALKDAGAKRVTSLKEKSNSITDVTYRLEGETLMIEDGECRLHGRKSLKGKWRSWSRFDMSQRQQWPHPWALVQQARTGRPLALFAMHGDKDKKAKFAYLLIFKSPPVGSRVENGVTESRSTDDRFSDATSFELAGRRFRAAFELDLDAQTKVPIRESLRLGPTPVDLGQSRCFVVDLTQKETIYHPVKVDLPELTLDLTEDEEWVRPEGWVRPVMQAVDDLQKKSPELQKLLNPSAKSALD
jgi:hypothetical protein